MAKKKANTLDEKDLDLLKQYVEAINKLTMEIGSIEVQKNVSIGKQVKLKEEFQSFSEGIQFKYGKISIDIQTGEYKAEEEVKEEAKPEADGSDQKN